MANHLRLRLLSLFFLGLPIVSSLDCKGCVEGLNILLEDHLSQASVEGQTQILTYQLCGSLDFSQCEKDISYFWPLFAKELWPYLLDSSVLCEQYCPSEW